MWLIKSGRRGPRWKFTDPRKKTTEICSFIVAAILRVGLAIQVTGCATVGLPNPTIADVRDTVSVVLQLTLLLAVVALVITIVRRSFRKRHGTVIVPFDVNSPDGKYSGK